MLMKVSETRSYWCPHIRVTGAGSNIDAGGRQFYTCIGPTCSQWRYAQKKNPEWKNPATHGMSWPPNHPDDDPPMYIEDDSCGYCGLAGRP